MRYFFITLLLSSTALAAESFPLWDETAPLPVASEIPLLEGVDAFWLVTCELTG